MDRSSAPSGTRTTGTDTSRSDGPPVQFIGFRLDGSDYAVAIRKVQEIILMPPITRLPQVPDEVEGLINLRGTVLPVINLRKRFGLPAIGIDDETRIVVVNVEEKTVGMIVDSVTQVMRVVEGEVQSAPPGVSSVAKGAIAGLFKQEDRFVIVLNIDVLLGNDDLGLDRPESSAGGDRESIR